MCIALPCQKLSGYWRPVNVVNPLLVTFRYRWYYLGLYVSPIANVIKYSHITDIVASLPNSTIVSLILNCHDQTPYIVAELANYQSFTIAHFYPKSWRSLLQSNHGSPTKHGIKLAHVSKAQPFRDMGVSYLGTVALCYKPISYTRTVTRRVPLVSIVGPLISLHFLLLLQELPAVFQTIAIGWPKTVLTSMTQLLTPLGLPWIIRQSQQLGIHTLCCKNMTFNSWSRRCSLLILSRPDYCNYWLSKLPKSSMRPLDLALNLLAHRL